MENKFDKNGFALKDIIVTVYNYEDDNHEFISESLNSIVEGSGIPALSTLIEPNIDKLGFSQVFNEDKNEWEYTEDHRGEDRFSTIDGSKVEIKELGPLPENTTDQAKPDGHYKWNGETWVEDTEAKDEARKQSNIAFLSYETRRTNDAIELLDDAIEFEMATDEEIAQHKELRKYRLLLSRVPNQETWLLNPVFPTCPDFFLE